MPVPTEVDDLDRQIVRLEEDLRKRRLKVEQIKNDIAETKHYVTKCQESRDLCLKNLLTMKKSSLVSLQDYRDVFKLYEDNCDLLLQHQIAYSNRLKEVSTVQETIPILEGFLVEAKKRRAEWGVLVEFPK